MANLRLSRLVLYDKWPGVPNPNAGIPTTTINGKAGWDNTIDNFSTADDTAKAANPPVPIGQKRQAYTDNTNCPGMYTMMYLCLHSFEDGMDVSKDFSDGHFFHSPHLTTNSCISNSEWADTSRGPYFVVARCTTGSDFTSGSGAVAIPCCTHVYSDGTGVSANGYGDGYGWFWVGGVCPCKDITILDNTGGSYTGVDLTVDSALGTGPVFLESTGAAALLMGCDESNFFDNTTGVVTGPNPTGMAIGWACASAA